MKLAHAAKKYAKEARQMRAVKREVLVDRDFDNTQVTFDGLLSTYFPGEYHLRKHEMRRGHV